MIRNNHNKKNYDVFYEIGTIKRFFSDFKIKKFNKIEKEIIQLKQKINIKNDSKKEEYQLNIYGSLFRL